MDQPASTLSGGEQQMLGLASTLMLDPTILLIDELSLGLAPIVVEQLLEVVARLRSTGLTIVIVEQSVNVALAVADRAVFMEKGEVRFEGAAVDLLERDDLMRAVFLGGGVG
jgi:ABC-type branched-subunit amino acid transport system ATPase component